MPEIFNTVSPGTLLLSLLFTAVILNFLLFSVPVRKFFSKHMTSSMLVIYFCGFLLYVIGFYYGASTNIVTVSLRAAGAALEMFASRSELLEVSERLKEDSEIYMVCFSTVHFLAVILTLSVIVEIFGKRLYSSFELISIQYGNPNLNLYIFDGAGENDMRVARTLPEKEKNLVLFVKGTIDTDIKKFSIVDVLISGIKTQDGDNIPKNWKILYTSMPLSYALSEKKGRLYRKLFKYVKRYRSARVFFLSDNSQGNADAAYDLSKDLKLKGLRATIYAGVNEADPYNYKLESMQDVYTVNRSSMRVQQLMDCTPILGDGIGRDTLIIGFGHTGKECLLKLEKAGFDNVDIIDKGIKYSNFISMHPEVKQHEGYQFHDFDISGNKFWEFIRDNIQRIRNVVVINQEDSKSYTIGIRILEHALKTGVNMANLRIYIMEQSQNSAVYAKAAIDKYGITQEIFFPFGSFESIYDYKLISKTEKHVIPTRKAGIDVAIRLAETKFMNKVDLDGKPAVLHLIAVGMAGKTEDEMIVGFLHDVVEDTSSDFEQLHRIGFSDSVLEALRLCTHNSSISYDEYVEKILKSGNQTAINVKINDLQHNIARGHESLAKAIEQGDKAKIANLTRINTKHEKALAKFQAQAS